MPGYLDRFRPLFDGWVGRSKADLLSGEAFLRSEALKAKKPFEQSVDSLTSADAQMMAAASKPLIIENCSALLKAISPASN